MVRNYTLLLHDAVRAHMVSLDVRAKQRLREKLEFLQEGLWDAGVRVKKLKGSGRAVFEARLSRGDRILFTLGEPPAADANGNGAGATRIYVWGVVKHDDVRTSAERRIVPGNAPFLDFEPALVEELPQFDAGDLDGDYFSPALDQPIAAPSADAPTDAGPQRWLVVDDEEWRRLLATHQGDHLELYLFLTREQARLVHDEPPLLLSGTAGSGKTTIAVYFLLRHRVRQLAAAPEATGEPAGGRSMRHATAARGGGARGQSVQGAEDGTAVAAGAERALFLTCSPHLKRFSQRIYRGLVKATELEDAAPAVRFATLGELLGEIMGRAGRPQWQASPAGLVDFHAIFRNHPGAARYDAELVWEEIRSIIKGAKPPVSRRRFAELAAQFAAAQAAQRERNELAEYVVRLGNLEPGARLDNARGRKTGFGSLQEFAASLRDGATARRDEQIFLLQAALRLLERQATRLDQPLLTLREYEGLGHKRAPNFPFDRRDIHRIAEYYQERLEAAGRFDEIDQTRAALQYLERHGDQFRYDLVVCDEVQDFTDMQLALLFRLAGDPRRTVLTGDPKQIINPSGFRWEEVRARYYERGLQVPEVINLSINFRSVGNIVSLANSLLLLKRSLVGLASGEITERWTFRGRPPLLVEGLAERDLLATVRRGGAGQVVLVRTERERDRLRKALQSELVFTVGEAKGLEFDSILLWRFPAAEGAPAIWRRIAADQVRAAADTPHVRHELNLLYVAVTRARNTLVIWDGEEVSPIWGIETLADQVYRSADGAAVDTLWRRVSTPAEWQAQGDYFMEREHFAAAEECYRNAQAEVDEELARAHRLEREGDHQAAAALFIRHGRVARAAEGLERAGEHLEAARIWRGAGNEMRGVACEAKHYEALGDHAAAADRWQQLGVEEGMLRNWERGREFAKLARFYLEREVHGEAARYLTLCGDHARAAEQFRRAGMLKSSAAEYELAGDHERAAVLYRRLGDNDGLLRSLFNAGMFHDAGLLYEKRGDLERATDCFRRHAASSPRARQELERRLEGIIQKHPGMRAAIRMVALGQPERAAPIYFRYGHPERAAELFRAAGQRQSAAQCLAECGSHREAAREVAAAGSDEDIQEAAKYLVTYLAHGDPDGPDRAGELLRSAGRLLRAGNHQLALAHYLAVGSARGGAFMVEVTVAYAGLERHAAALEYCLHSGRGAKASAYLDARPELVLDPSEVESLVRGPGEDTPPGGRTGPGGRTRLEREDEAVEGVLFRLMHGCLFRGTAPDRRQRMAALLHLLPARYGHTCPLFVELSDLIVELRRYDVIIDIHTSRMARQPPPDELHDHLVSRLQRTAEAQQDPELALCTLLDDRPAFDVGLNELEVSERNVMLFAHSRRHYSRAVAFLLQRGDTDRAASACVFQDDYAGAGRIYEQAGDVALAARFYRDGMCTADALRCFEAIGDEAEMARIYERQHRFDEALAIWQRRGRAQDVERVRNEMARRGADLE